MTAGSWSTPWPTDCGPATPGGCCSMTCRPGRPSTPTSAAGGSRDCGNRSTPPSASRSGSAKAERPRPARRSWTARASRPLNGRRHGDDGAKRVNGCQRHLLVDTLGLVCKVRMTAADVGDRDGALELLGRLDRRRFPRHGWADGGYRGPFLDWAHQRRGIAFQVVQRHDGGRRRRWLPPGATPPIVSPFAVVPPVSGGADLRLAGAIPAAQQGLRVPHCHLRGGHLPGHDPTAGPPPHRPLALQTPYK
jgi:hypothetical protein